MWDSVQGQRALVQEPVHQVNPRVSGALYIYTNCQTALTFTFWGVEYVYGYTSCDLWVGDFTTGNRFPIVTGVVVNNSGYDIDGNRVIWTEESAEGYNHIYYGVLKPMPAPNRAPVAAAGSDNTVFVGQNGTLSGCASSDPDGNPLTFTWKDSGGLVVGTTCSLTVSSPAAPVARIYALTVSDGALSASDQATITWSDPTVPILEVATPAPGTVINRTINLGIIGTISVPLNYVLPVRGMNIAITVFSSGGALVSTHNWGFFPTSSAIVGGSYWGVSVLPSDMPSGTIVEIVITATVQRVTNSSDTKQVKKTIRIAPDGTVSVCYILTASFGRPDHPVIKTLWEAHQRLVGNQWNAPWHQAYMRWYDKVGPKIAAWISDKPWIKALIRNIASLGANLTK